METDSVGKILHKKDQTMNVVTDATIPNGEIEKGCSSHLFPKATNPGKPSSKSARGDLIEELCGGPFTRPR